MPKSKLYIPSTLNIDLILKVLILNQLCVQKILNHGLNHGFFLSLFKLIPCPIHWIVYVWAYSNFIFDFLNSFSTTQNSRLCPDNQIISLIWIVWSTLYVYLWPKCKRSKLDNLIEIKSIEHRAVGTRGSRDRPLHQIGGGIYAKPSPPNDIGIILSTLPRKKLLSPIHWGP